jgi:hypothetical protein
MSYFLCVAVPQEFSNEVFAVFGEDMYISAASQFPIGLATIGNHENWSAYILQIGSSSASLIAKGAIKKNSPNYDRSSLFVSGILSLLARTKLPSICFLAHWMHGYITTEEVVLQDKEDVVISNLHEVMKNIREDVQYTVLREDI